jgi:hypothetical protein
MTIHLPEDLQRYIQDQVVAGRFRTEDDVILEALERHRQTHQLPPGSPVPPDPLLGSMRDDADLLDEIVEHAMKNRREQPWRVNPVE